MTKILLTYKGKQRQSDAQPAATYDNYWPDGIGPGQPKKRRVKDQMSTPRALQIATYALQSLADAPDVKAAPGWSDELLEAANHLSHVRRGLLSTEEVAAATLDRAGLKY